MPEQPESEVLQALHEINIQSGKVFLRIAPPQLGLKADLDQIQEELHEIDIDYIPEKLLEIYEKESNELELLCDEKSVDYQFTIELTRAAASAYLTVHPPSLSDVQITIEMLEESLSEKGIIQGVMGDVLQKIIDEKIENEPVLIARGKKPINGKDGYIQLVYGKEEKQLDEKRVNHREMQVLSNAKSGDVLANIIAPTQGKNGYNIKGVPLAAKAGKKCALMPGRHTTFNADRTQIQATNSGYVVLQNQQISIENIYRVTNVDNSVGNLSFDGIIYVDGNIEDGYSVNATVNIEVRGTVGKATLITDGGVKVKQGMLGTTVKAGGSVNSVFISDATIEAGKNVIVKEYIINSNISAGKVIHITDSEGFFHGGVCHGGNFVHIPNIGSSKIGDQTMVEVGIDPEVRRHFKVLESTISQGLYNFSKIKKNLLLLQHAREKRGVLKEEHEKVFQEMLEGMAQTRDETIQSTKEWRNMIDIIKIEQERDGGIVFIKGNVFPGAIIKIRRMLYHVKLPVAHAAFLSTKGRIQMQDYEDVIWRYRRFFI